MLMKAGVAVGKNNTWFLLVGIQSDASTVEVSKNLKVGPAHGPAIAFLCRYSEDSIAY